MRLFFPPACYPANVIEIFKIRSFVDQFPIQFAICAGVSAGEGKPLISDKRFFVGEKRKCSADAEIALCNCKFRQTHFIFERNPRRVRDEIIKGAAVCINLVRSYRCCDLSLHLSRSLVVRKIRWFEKVKYANATTRDTRVKPWESSEIITRKITNVFVPSCSERWSNFLKMYNSWIKTLLNNWYITSFRFSSENDRTSKIPETWLRSLAFSSLIFFWFLWCRADNFSSKNYWLRLKDAPIHLLSHPCQLSYLRPIDSPAAKWKDRSWSSF